MESGKHRQRRRLSKESTNCQHKVENDTVFKSLALNSKAYISDGTGVH